MALEGSALVQGFQLALEPLTLLRLALAVLQTLAAVTRYLAPLHQMAVALAAQEVRGLQGQMVALAAVGGFRLLMEPHRVVLVIHHQFQLQRFKDMMVVMGLVRTRLLLEVAAAVQTELVLMVQGILLEMAVLHKYQLFLVHRFTMQAAAVAGL